MRDYHDRDLIDTYPVTEIEAVNSQVATVTISYPGCDEVLPFDLVFQASLVDLATFSEDGVLDHFEGSWVTQRGKRFEVVPSTDDDGFENDEEAILQYMGIEASVLD